MARKPASDTPRPDPRQSAVEALMALVVERGWRDVELPAIAERAGMPLSQLRDLFPSKGAMLAGFGRMIDKQVLDGMNPDLAGEPARERVLDLMMRRFDALAPYKPALREISQTVRRDPLMAAALNQSALNSWRYLLGSVGVPVEDELGMIKVQGAIMVFARVADTWLDDDEPDMVRTMAKLDRELQNGERVLRMAEDVNRIAAPFRGLARAICERGQSMRRRERAEPGAARRGDDGVMAV
jgi:AcrR family transcriptional regulator